MDSGLPEIFDQEYRRLKRITRAVLLLVMAYPIYVYGPMIWKDGSYAGRWIFAADIPQGHIECSGVPYFLQSCEVKFLAANRPVKFDYLVAGTSWSEGMTDIVRSAEGRVTAAVGVTGPGLLSRVGALFALLMFCFLIERIIWGVKFHSLRSKVFGFVPTTNKRESVMLSRDRRDHL